MTAPAARNADSLKTVGRRSDTEDPLGDAGTLQRTIQRLRDAPLVPRGVYRFRTFEEADEWMMREMARAHARRHSRISPSSASD